MILFFLTQGNLIGQILQTKTLTGFSTYYKNGSDYGSESQSNWKGFIGKDDNGNTRRLRIPLQGFPAVSSSQEGVEIVRVKFKLAGVSASKKALLKIGNNSNTLGTIQNWYDEIQGFKTLSIVSSTNEIVLERSAIPADILELFENQGDPSFIIGIMSNDEGNSASSVKIEPLSISIEYFVTYQLVIDIKKDGNIYFPKGSTAFKLNGQQTKYSESGHTVYFRENSSVVVAANHLLYREYITNNTTTNYDTAGFDQFALDNINFENLTFQFAKIASKQNLILNYKPVRTLRPYNELVNGSAETHLPGTTFNIYKNGALTGSGLSGEKYKIPIDKTIKTETGVQKGEISGFQIDHQNWDGNLSKYQRFFDFETNSNTVVVTQIHAKHHPIYTQAMQVSLEGIVQSNQGVQFKDPWKVVNGSRPWNWDSYSRPFTPGSGEDAGYGGLFISVPYDPSFPNAAHYRLSAPNLNTMNGADCFFISWGGTGGYFYNPTSLETPVRFDAANAVVTANYKGRLRTGNPSNYAKNQNRLAIQTTDGQPSILVYDSMNEIWLNRQDEYELSWANELRLSGNTATATNPSISNEIQVTSSDYRRWAITWVENGLIHLQLMKSNRFGGGDFTYGWSTGANNLIQDDYNHIILESDLIDKYGVPLSTARPVVNLSYYPNDTAPTSLIVTVAYEGKTSASATATTIIQNELVFPVELEGTSGNNWSDVSPFYTCTAWSGNRYRALTTENVSGMPVVIRYNARGTNPAKHAVYYLASTGTGTTFTKLMEYNLTTGVNTPITGLSYVRSFSSLSGNCNYTSGGIVLAAEAAIYDYYNPSNPYYDKPTVAVYVKSVSSATTPALSKTYTNYRSGVVMVDQGAVASTPVYEVNMLPVSGTQWAKATGGTSVTYIQGSNIVQPFVSGRVPAGTRKSVVIQSGSPAKFLNYGGSGVLQKGEGSAADVRAHRTVELSNGEQKEVILDFTGTRVEPVDSLEAGSVICAVQFLTESATSILVSQPDSLIFPLGVNIIRKGVSIRSYKSGLWAALSSQSFEDLQRGDILVFRSDVPVTMLINYEEFNLDGADGAGKGNIEGVSGTQLSSIKTGVAVYPNPFNPATSIAVSLESPEVVRVTVFNILGQLITDFGKTDLGAGVHNFPFDGRLLASGTYFYRVEIGDKVKTGKLQLLK